MGLKLTTFSRPRLIDDVGETVAFPEKGLVALAYLFTTKHLRASRAELAEFLWGDSEQSNTLGNLRQLLARLKVRQAEGSFQVLDFDGGDVALLSDHLACDLAELPVDLERDAGQALRTMCATMDGEFLSGIAMGSSKADFWMQAQRSRHNSQLTRAIELFWQGGEIADFDLLHSACVLLLTLDPFSIFAHKTLLEAFAATDQKARAQAHFSKYEQRIRDEFGVGPEPALASLMLDLFPRTPAVPVSRDVMPDRRMASQFLPRLLILPPSEARGVSGTLALALVEDITIALCQARTLAIVAPETARKIARNSEDQGRDLVTHRVGYSLETRLCGESGGLSLFCGLTDVLSDELVWANRFDVNADHLSRSYREIVLGIVAAATLEIENYEFAKIARATEPTAYQHYLLGQHHLRRIGLAQIRKARGMFRNSLRVAPNFPNALSGLARAEHLEWLVTARGDTELLRSSERHARRAIEADPKNPGGYHQLGVTRLYGSDFDESVNAFEQAERLAPSHADLIADYADTLVHASDPELALQKIEKAIDLNPLCPDVYWWTAAGANYCLGNFERALESVSKMDDQSGATRLAAACWGMLGDTTKARRLMRKTMAIYPDFELEKWLSIMPLKESWHKEQYREGLRRAGFK